MPPALEKVQKLYGFKTRAELDAFFLGVDIAVMETAGLPLTAAFRGILKLRRDKLLGDKREFKASGFNKDESATKIFNRNC